MAVEELQRLHLQLVLAGDDHSLVEVLDLVGEELRVTTGEQEAFIKQIADGLVRVAQHPNWEVRKAVAHALLHLRGDEFHVALARLLDDENAWVRNAAQRTKTRRSEISRAGLLKDEHANMVLRRLSDLEAQHGKQARQAVMREVDWNTEMVMRGVYHELVKPIDALMTALEAAEISGHREGVSTATLNRINTARDRVDFLKAVLESLREWAKHVEPEYAPESLRNIVEGAVGLLRDRVRPRRGRLQVDIEIDPAVTIEAHRHCLTAAFLNILTNAYEAYFGLARRCEIRISAVVEDGARATIRFVDRGCGMSDEGVSQAFKLFTTNKARGTGFGLPYSKKMVEVLHHGSIRIESKLGLGTAVIVTLPVEQEQKD